MAARGVNWSVIFWCTLRLLVRWGPSHVLKIPKVEQPPVNSRRISCCWRVPQCADGALVRSSPSRSSDVVWDESARAGKGAVAGPDEVQVSLVPVTSLAHLRTAAFVER